MVKTKFDPDTQDEIQNAVSKVVGPTDPMIAAMDMIEPGTGSDRGDGPEPAGDGRQHREG